jgi:fatty-acyl-CoA synthase
VSVNLEFRHEEREFLSSSRGIPTEGWSEAITLGDLLLRSAAAHGNRPALVFPDAEWSYAQLAARAREIARGLVGSGLQRGEHVGLLMPNSFDCLAAIFGVALAHGVIVPLNSRHRTRELRHTLTAGDVVMVLTSCASRDYVDFHALLCDTLPDLRAALDPSALALESAPLLRSIVMIDGEDFAGALGAAAFAGSGALVSDEQLSQRRAGVRLRDRALILFTSGTTAAPRGCLIAHEALVRNWTGVGRRIGVVPDDRVWTPIPFFHIGGIGYAVATLSHGAALLSSTHFERETALDFIESRRATVLTPVFPPIVLAVMHDARFGEANLTNVRVVVVAAAEGILRQVQAAFPDAKLLTTYGLTETTGVVMFSAPEDPLELRMTTCGRTQPGVELRIVDPGGIRLPPGEEGEIEVRGWNVTDGYYGDSERTVAMFRDGGWLRTMDRGRVDQDGNLSFVGRLGDMIKVGGENVAPAEVEAHLGGHPAVHIVQVVGVADEALGQVPAAFIELKPGASASTEELTAYCAGQIARFKIPRHWRFVESWPMSATKIQKARLRDQWLAEVR